MKRLVICILICLACTACSALTCRELKRPGSPAILCIDAPSQFLTLGIFVPNVSYPLSGTAHMAEHLMFGSSRDLAAGELDLRLETLGYSADAYTSYDFTCYTCILRPGDLEAVCGLFAKALSSPLFDEQELALEKGIIRDEMAGKGDRETEELRRALLKTVYGDCLYGLPLEGADIDAITREDLALYHSLNYTNDNYVFVAAGPVDDEELIRVIGGVFPASGQKPAATAPAMEVKSGVTTLSRGGYFGLAAPMAPGYLFGESVCCGVLTSLIYGLVRQELPAAETGYRHNTGRHASPFTLTVKSPEAERVCLEAVEAVRRGSYSDSALEAAQKLQLTDFLTRNQTGKNLVYQLGQMYILHGLKGIGDYTDFVSGVSREDIARAAEKYL